MCSLSSRQACEGEIDRPEDHNNHTFRLDYTHTYFCITMWLNIISVKHNSQLDTHALYRIHLKQTLEVKSTWGMSCWYGKPSAVSVRPAHILHRAHRRAASGMSGARVLSRTAPITSAVGWELCHDRNVSQTCPVGPERKRETWDKELNVLF